MRKSGGTVALLVAATLVAGCGSGGQEGERAGREDRQAVRVAVLRLQSALVGADGEQFCAHVTPTVRRQLARAGDRCATAVGRALKALDDGERRRIADAPVAGAMVMGDRAHVAFVDGATLALSHVDGRWLVAGSPDWLTVTRERYVEILIAVHEVLERTWGALGKEISGGTDEAGLGAALDRGARALSRATADLRALFPPPDARGPHRKLVSGMRHITGRFRDGAAAVRRRDIAGLTRSFSGIERSDGARQLRQALAQLRARGYEADR